ncbi:unknown [Sutterella wadsworthensis CAG:135]|nr:unknown [Sutterella wadsworthensis CAG:135]
MLAFIVVEAGVEDDVLHAVLHEGIVGLAVGIARIVRVGEIVAE